MVDKVHINANTLVLFEVKGASGDPQVLNEVESLGNPSQRRSEVNATPLASDTVRYIGGLKDGQTLDITMFLLTDDVSQLALKAAYDTNSIIEITVQPPPGVGKQFRFDYTLLGHDLMIGNGAEAAKRMVTGRISSDLTIEANARV